MPLLCTFAAGSVNGYTLSGSLFPPISGYIGLYTASSWTGTQWTDLSGAGNHVVTTTGSPAIATSSGNGASKSFLVLQGSTAAGLLWPVGILPATYTFFHVTRHNGTRGRIFSGADANWLSGFWSGLSGQAYHAGWLTNNVTDYYGSNWVISSDQNSFYRGYGIGSSNEGTGGGASTRLAIGGYATYPESSDWQIAEIIIYNYTLTQTDRLTVESYLRNKYGI